MPEQPRPVVKTGLKPIGPYMSISIIGDDKGPYRIEQRKGISYIRTADGRYHVRHIRNTDDYAEFELTLVDSDGKALRIPR